MGDFKEVCPKCHRSSVYSMHSLDNCHEGFVDEYISKTKLMRIVDKYCGRENKDG